MIVSFGDPTESHGQTTHDSDVIEVRRRRCSRVRVIPTVDFASDDPCFAGTMTMTWKITAVQGGT